MKVGWTVDRVSGTKPPPKINAVPASLCLSSGRPAGSHSSSSSSSEVSGARQPVTGTTCHQFHCSPISLDQRHGRQACWPTKARVYSALTQHAYINIHTLTNSPSAHLQGDQETRRPLMKTCRGAGDNVQPDPWTHARLPSQSEVHKNLSSETLSRVSNISQLKYLSAWSLS